MAVKDMFAGDWKGANQLVEPELMVFFNLTCNSRELSVGLSSF